MSLRLRLIVSIGLILLASLTAGGLLAWRHAVRSVETELAASLAVGSQNLRSALDDLPAEDGPELARLIAAFDGDRHLRARLIAGNGTSLARSAPAAAERRVPSWFVRSLAIPPTQRTIALPAGHDAAAVTLETDPQNEIGEVWSEGRDFMATLALFCALTLAFIYWSIGTALRPLKTLSAGFRAVGLGDYGARAVLTGPPELAALAGGFNLMAERLGMLERQTEQLNAQLLTLQEEERADLARDLHDEIGPFLFAVNVDAAAILGLKGAESAPIRERIGAIQDAVGHMQRQVREILGRLRPAALPEVGLRQATDNLAAFWRHRHPEVTIVIDLPQDEDRLGDSANAAIYRVIQESLSNAIRHGRPSLIEVSVSLAPDGGLTVQVSDDGSGLAEPAHPPGYGLTGMRERVAALGGRLTLANRVGCRGAAVTAILPARSAP